MVFSVTQYLTFLLFNFICLLNSVKISYLVVQKLETNESSFITSTFYFKEKLPLYCTKMSSTAQSHMGYLRIHIFGYWNSFVSALDWIKIHLIEWYVGIYLPSQKPILTGMTRLLGWNPEFIQNFLKTYGFILLIL